MNIKKGDQVKIISGKDRGKVGSVFKIFMGGKNKATVDGLNLYRKRVRPKTQGQKGETVLVPRPLDMSNLMLICGSCKRPSRIGYRTAEGRKTRYCKKCGAAA